MEHNIQELNCVRCKTRMIVKTNGIYDENEYRLIYCPTCHAPIREILSDKWFEIEKVNNVNE